MEENVIYRLNCSSLLGLKQRICRLNEWRFGLDKRCLYQGYSLIVPGHWKIYKCYIVDDK